MRKILMLNTVATARNGISAVILNYAKHIDKNGIQIDFLAINEVEDSLKMELESIGKIHQLSMRNRSPIEYVMKLAKIIRVEKYDTVHIHGNSSTMAADLLAAKLGGAQKRIAHAHNTQCDHIFLHKLLRLPFRLLCTQGLACSVAAGKFLFGSGKFKVLRNAIELEKYKFNEQTRAVFREKLGLKNELAIVQVATLTPPKNHKFILDVFAAFSFLTRKSKMFLIGEGELKQELENYAKELHLENNIVFVGSVPNVNEYLNAMDLMILPSIYEGFGIVMLESQANGLPALLSSNVPRECKVSDLVKGLPLKKEVWKTTLERYMTIDSPLLDGEGWQARIADRELASRSAIENLRKSGFDIEREAEELRRIYAE